MRVKVVTGTVTIAGVVIAVVITMALAASQEVRKLDMEHDGVTDTWQFYVRGKKVKEIIDYNHVIPRGKHRVILFWDPEGQLEKEISIEKEAGGRIRKGTFYYKKGNWVLGNNGERLLKQSLDVAKTYRKSSDLSDFIQNVYVKDRSILLMEDNAYMGKELTHKIFFENNRMSRTELDNRPFNHPDGKADEITYYKDGRSVRHEKDTDGDGKMDQITNLTINPPTPAKVK